MPFITKLDFSNNRQVKQNIETNTVLSGGTSFGVPFNQLPTGPDPLTSGVTSLQNGVVSTFSGNSATTVYSWYTPIMGLADSVLSAWTPSNSATTQNTGNLFSAATTATTVDGNLVTLTYTGASFDVEPISMVDLGSGNYSGTVNTAIFETLSAGTIDFTGRTIWVDVSGITRTDELIITKNPTIGYVLTCVDSEGRVAFQPSSGGTSATTVYWSAGSGTNAIVMRNSNGTAIDTLAVAEGFSSFAKGAYSRAQNYDTTASGVASHAEGFQTTTDGDYSHAEGINTTASGGASHTEGSGSTASGIASHAGGYNCVSSGLTSFVHGYNSKSTADYVNVFGRNLTGNTADTTYVDNLNINTVGAGPGSIDIGVDINGNVVNQASDLRLKKNITNIENALDKVKALRGVKYQWKDEVRGGDEYRIGFIAQEVNEVEPTLIFIDKKSEEQYMGVQYKDVTALLVEAVKELSSGSTINTNTYLETQTIKAEDNNIELNFNGTKETSVGGGIFVLNALGENKSAELKLDSEGNWVTNTGFKPQNITIPNFTPASSADKSGSVGDVSVDDNYMYVKTRGGWTRVALNTF
jgi:hypothetical protein